MSYIHDAIIESNQLEDEQILSNIKAKKNPPTLKRRLQIDEECKEDKEECNPEDKEENLSEEYEELDEEKLTEEKMVDIEQYLGPENYVESFNRESDEKLDEEVAKIEPTVVAEYDTEEEAKAVADKLNATVDAEEKDLLGTQYDVDCKEYNSEKEEA